MINRELDELVATKIMGWKKCKVNQGSCGFEVDGWASPDGKTYTHLPAYYSHDIKAAWEVVQKMYDDDYHVSIQNCHPPNWCVFFYGNKDENDNGWGEDIETIEEAICIAALDAIGVSYG